MSEKILASLRKMGIFKSLEDELLKNIVVDCRWKKYPRGASVIGRSSASTDIVLVYSGHVRVSIFSLSGREISFIDHGPGEFVGEIAAIDGKPRTANVIAIKDTEVGFLSSKRFKELMQTYPSVAMSVAEHLASMLRASTQRIIDLSTVGANNRVHAELLRLAKDNLQGDNKAMISPLPVHNDIAARVSVTRETVARVISDLTKNDIVTKKGEGLLIRDFDRLDAMVAEVRSE